MTEIYLDTNIFIYLANTASPFFQSCKNLIEKCQAESISLSTSTETIQELIHFAKNKKQLSIGVSTAHSVLALVDNLYSITAKTIDIYLEKADVYQHVKSRDLIHLAVCLENNVDTIITYDKEFSSFKEKNLKTLQPQEFS